MPLVEVLPSVGESLLALVARGGRGRGEQKTWSQSERVGDVPTEDFGRGAYEKECVQGSAFILLLPKKSQYRKTTTWYTRYLPQAKRTRSLWEWLKPEKLSSM